MDIWKLIGLSVVFAALAVGMPFALVALHLMTLSPGAGLVVFATMVALQLKMLFADAAGKGIEYHKQGHDLCIITMVGLLSALAFQLTSATDLFPRLSTGRIWRRLFGGLSLSVVNQRLAFLVCLLLISVVLSFITAKISNAIRGNQARAPAILSAVSFLLGAALFSSYLLVLITKA